MHFKFFFFSTQGDRVSKQLFYYCPVCYDGPGSWGWALGEKFRVLTLTIPPPEVVQADENLQVNDVARGTHGYKYELEEIKEGQMPPVEWVFAKRSCPNRNIRCHGKFNPEEHNCHPTQLSKESFTYQETDLLEKVN
jgi:hypothetical protein